jgi:hypothetical protein
MDTTEIIIAAVVVVLLGGGGFAFWWVRLRVPEEAEVFHFRCPGCGRRLRYLERQVGRKGECSSCKGLLTFPPTSKSIP